MDGEIKETRQESQFLDPSGRSRAFTLKHPVVVNGRAYREIRLVRLTVAEVAQFFEAVNAGEKLSVIAWPVYRDENGEPIPLAVLNALDDDDGLTIEQGLRDFLPRRLQAFMDGAGAPPAGEPTASSSAA
jgi:hypothetical protein